MGWRRYFRRQERERDFELELGSYLAEETADNIARGMSAQDAAWAARRKFGNLTAAREEIHRMNTITALESMGQDLRYAARQIQKEPGFFGAAILCLALGIGANTAIFHLLDAVRLRTLPVDRPGELAEVQIAPNDKCCTGNFSSRRSNFTYALWDELRTHQQAFSGLFAWSAHRFHTTTGGQVRDIDGLYASGEFFSTLRVTPAAGRLLTDADDRPGCGSPGAVLGYAYWQRAYGGDPAAVGRTIRLDGTPFPIVGVSRAGFFGVEVGRAFDVAVPVCAETLINGENAHTPKRHHWWLAVIGRVRPGWTVEKARAHVAAISAPLFAATVPPNFSAEPAKNYLTFRLTADSVAGGVSGLRETYQDPLLILLAIAALVLVIACANLANLMLARANARERELAVRLAIGASRPRLVRQMLAESLLLATIGALSGALLAHFLSDYLVRFLSTTDTPLYIDLGTDWRIFLFAAALAVVTCLLFGLMPALRATGTNPGAVLKAAGRGNTEGRERFTLRRVLVVAQVALSLVLLTGALLFVRSLHKLTSLNAGFQPDGVLVTEIDLSRTGYPADRRFSAQREVLERIRQLPGVEAAGATNIVPISGDRWNDRFQFVGDAKNAMMLSNFLGATPGYFRTLATPLIAGRDFSDRDTPGSPKVAVVNEAFTREFLQGANPIGKRIRIETGPGEPELFYEIVGLVKDAKYRRLSDPFSSTVYTSLEQDPRPQPGTAILSRSHQPLAARRAAVARAVASVHPAIDINTYTLDSQIEDSLLRQRLMATLSGFFGFLAAVLASIGLYGVMAYVVVRRRGEIGIRMALGAGRASVLGLIGRECGKLLAIGLVLGIAGAAAASRAIATLLYGLSPGDPLTLALAAALLALVALPATIVPAIRAARLDPMRALREE